MTEEFNRIVLLSDYGSLDLTKEIYDHLKDMDLHGGLKPFDPDDMYLNLFNNTEVQVKINANVRGRNVFVIKSPYTIQRRWNKNKGIEPGLENNVNQSYMETFLINDALKRSSAKSITNIMSFMPYQRSDKKDEPRVPIAATVMGKLTEASGADRVINFNPHAEQIQGFYDIPFDALYSEILFAEHIENNYKDLDNWIVFGPDAGSNTRVNRLAKWLGIPSGVGDKKRPKPGEVSNIMVPPGVKIKGKKAIILDDMGDTLGSLIRSAQNLYDAGIVEVESYITHPILSTDEDGKDAKDKALENGLKIVTTNSIPIPEQEKYPNITVLSLAGILSEAIKCINTGDSISSHLFSYPKYKEWKQKIKP